MCYLDGIQFPISLNFISPPFPSNSLIRYLWAYTRRLRWDIILNLYDDLLSVRVKREDCEIQNSKLTVYDSRIQTNPGVSMLFSKASCFAIGIAVSSS